MIFKILKKYSDTCGNSDSYLIGYCEFGTPEDAQKAFGFPTMFVSYVIEPVQISTPEEIRRRFDKHKER